jgi:hypothetical protein
MTRRSQVQSLKGIIAISVASVVRNLWLERYDTKSTLRRNNSIRGHVKLMCGLTILLLGRLTNAEHPAQA